MHRGDGAGYGFRPHSINNLTKLVPADGSSRSAANAAMLTCEDFGNGAGLGNFAAGRYISHMPKRKRETEWEVIRLKATPAAFVGLVQAWYRSGSIAQRRSRTMRR